MKIILTDSAKNLNALFRRKNAAGTPVHGVEAQTPEQYAWNLLLEHAASASSPLLPRRISDATAASILLQLLKNQPNLQSFAPADCLCKAAAQEILNNMNLLRNTPHKATSDRARELEAICRAYESELAARNLYDATRILTAATCLLKQRAVSPADTIQYRFFGPIVPASITDFLDQLQAKPAAEYVPAPAPSVKKEKVRCFGMANEIEHVYNDIVEHKYNPADCEVIFTTEAYAPLLSMVCAKYRLPLLLENGETAAVTETAQMMLDLLSWQLQGTRYQDLLPVCMNPKFRGFEGYYPNLFLDGISYGVGHGADRYRGVIFVPSNPCTDAKKEEARRKYAQELLPAFADLSDGLQTTSAKSALDVLWSFIKEHAQKRNPDNRYLTPAIGDLQKDLGICDATFPTEKETLEYLRDTIAALPISRAEANGPALLAHSIAGPHVPERKHLYGIGFSDKEFRISTAESPVLDDQERANLFGVGCQTIPFAKDNRRREEQKYLDTFSWFAGEGILLTASTCDTVEKGIALSASAFFENLASPEWTERGEQTAYPNLIDKEIFLPRTAGWPQTQKAVPPQATIIISKSTLDVLLSCPLQYNYQKQLHISQEEYMDVDPDRWLAANERGTFIHKALELYCNAVLRGKSAVPPTFDSQCKEYQDAFAAAKQKAEQLHPAPSPAVQQKELEEFGKMLTDYLSKLHEELARTHWVILECEKSMVGLSESFGTPPLTLEYSGIIDRIDRRTGDEGTTEYRIIDYKTGSLDSLKDSKQHRIYAEYVRKEYGTQNVSFVYVGLKDGKEKLFSGAELSPILTEEEQEQVYQVLCNNDYSAAPAYTEGRGACTYCKYQDICLSRMKGDVTP